MPPLIPNDALSKKEEAAPTPHDRTLVYPTVNRARLAAAIILVLVISVLLVCLVTFCKCCQRRRVRQSNAQQMSEARLPDASSSAVGDSVSMREGVPGYCLRPEPGGEMSVPAGLPGKGVVVQHPDGTQEIGWHSKADA